MGIISVSLPTDGTTADVADVNTPFNTIVNEFNGNIDNTNIKSAAAIDGSKLADVSITNAKLATSTGEPGGAWSAWTPTWSNLTVGSGTVAAEYKQIGKTVNFRIKFTFGSGSSVGTTPTFTLPVTAITGKYAQFDTIGVGTLNDSGVVYTANVAFNSTTTAVPLYLAILSSIARYSALTATNPFTWASADYMFMVGTYEAA